MRSSLNWILAACLAFGLGLTVRAQAVIPGWLTDPTAVRDATTGDIGYMPPEHLRFPYISTYYVKPTVTTDEVVRIGFFVTDFESSKIRFLDDSHRFTAFLEYGLRGGTHQTVSLTDLHSGDAEFNLGTLPVGAYEMRVWAVDAQGRASHRVIHDFRVVTPESLTIPADMTYTMTAADLVSYGIRNDGDLEKIVYVNDTSTLVIKEKRADVPGYTVTVPVDEAGKVPYRAYEKASVAYDAGYDAVAVESNAVATAEGIQRLLNDKAAAGFRKLVMLPGTYRVSHRVPIYIPDSFTFDLGEATLKMNQHAGEKSVMVRIASAYDSHLVGGRIEGDYWAHDYAHSDKDSEWVDGFEVSGDTWYCSVENVHVVDITGYGGMNAMDSDPRGGNSFFYEQLPKFAAGGLNPLTGQVDLTDTNRFTTDFRNLTKITEQFGRHRLQISKYLGYQGIISRSWQMTVCWYDASKNFISSETCFQYREMWIPADAVYLRVSIEAGSLNEANPALYTDALSLTAFRYPINCEIKNCTFEHCRCVGYAAAQMKNWIFEGNFFTNSGEAEAKCAFDAEDGADQMQDVYFLRNTFRDNPINNSILTCAGHNFILEENDGGIYFWGRTYSPCVRSNNVEQATIYCDSRLRSGYGRFEGNRSSKTFKLGVNEMNPRPDNWDYVIASQVIDGAQMSIKIQTGLAGRLVDCTLRNMTSVSIANAYACTLENCSGNFSGANWVECTVMNSRFENFFNTNIWSHCHFQDSHLQSVNRATLFVNDCDFTNTTIEGHNGSTIFVTNSDFNATTIDGGWWSQPATIRFTGCTIRNTRGAPFMSIGNYTVGDIVFDSCSVTGSGGLFYVKDIRPLSSSNEALVGTVELKNTTWQSSSTSACACTPGAPDDVHGVKPITLIDNNNNWPDGVCMISELYETWTLVVLGPPCEHIWGPASYQWAADFSTCTATAVCAKNAEHVTNETVTASYSVSRPATVDVEGSARYTATFRLPFFATQTHSVVLPKRPPVQPASYYVSPTGDDTADGTSAETAFATIAHAVSVAQEGQKICILEGTYEISAAISINKAITVTGEGWGRTIIKPVSGADIRCVTLDGGAVLEGVTLTGGRYAGAGAGALVKDGTISWCCISNNTGTAGSVAGAGVSFSSGKGTIDHSVIANNTIARGCWGAGIGAKSPSGPITVDTCLIYGNVNPGGSGGGVGSDTTSQVLTVRNCTIVSNTASANAGGIYLNNPCNGVNGRLVLVNSIIAGNMQGSAEVNLGVQNGCLDTVNSGYCLLGAATAGDSGWGKKDRTALTLVSTFSAGVPAFGDGYRLAEAAELGFTDSSGLVDLDNLPRSGRIDVGCYEYGAVLPRRHGTVITVE